jgi:membrane protease YdiL (CAAX protease family)
MQHAGFSYFSTKKLKRMPREMRSSPLSAIAKSALCWVLFTGLLFLAGSLLSPMFPPQWERFVYGTSGTMAAFAAVWILLKTEKQSFSDYGLIWKRDTLWKFIQGLIIGSAIFLGIILILLAFTELRLVRNQTVWNPLSMFWYLAIIPLALMEEVAFRSYTFIKLNKAFGLWITQFIVAIGFAGYHIVQGWDWQMAVWGPAIWALVFGLAAVWSKGIALPTGIHVALNVIQELLSMKTSSYEAFWEFEYKTEATAETIHQTSTVGLITQVLVLVFAILFTYFYVRKVQKNPPMIT